MSFYIHAKKQIGNFTPKDTNNTIEYSLNDTGNEYCADMPHIIWVTNLFGSGYRYARILKTVAYIAIDEDENGKPILEKWKIKNHRNYDNDSTKDNTFTSILI